MSKSPSARSSGVILYDMDSIQELCEEDRRKREAQIVKVEAIIDEEIDKWIQWRAWIESERLVSALRRKYEGIRKKEIERYQTRFSDEDRPLLEQFTQRLMNKLLHDMTMNLRNTDRERAMAWRCWKPPKDFWEIRMILKRSKTRLPFFLPQGGSQAQNPNPYWH